MKIYRSFIIIKVPKASIAYDNTVNWLSGHNTIQK